jgi:3-oxoacyl-[acyl-carrier-protein] synthase-1
MSRIISDNIISPLGSSSTENYLRVKNGESGIAEYVDPYGVPGKFCLSRFSQELIETVPRYPGCSLFEDLIIMSVKAALEHTDIDAGAPSTLFVISSIIGNAGMMGEYIETSDGKVEAKAYHDQLGLSESSQRITNVLGNPNTPVVISNACISGVSAQLFADRMLSMGRFKNVIVTGCDMLSKFVLSGFNSLRAVSRRPCRPFDECRTGVNLGEAAATMVLSGDSDAKIGECWRLVAGAQRNDSFHISAPSPKAEGCFSAIRSVLKDYDVSKIACVNAHGTATMYNDEMEAMALTRMGLQDLPVYSLKGYVGHTMGASGIIESIISMKAVEDHTVIGTRGFEALGVRNPVHIVKRNQSTDKRAFLKIISGFGGVNAAVVYEKEAKDDKGTTSCSNRHV